MARIVNYYIKQSYLTNVFGADEHIAVTLYRDSTDPRTLNFVNQWTYSTFTSRRFAHSRAMKKVAELKRVYNASFID